VIRPHAPRSAIEIIAEMTRPESIARATRTSIGALTIAVRHLTAPMETGPLVKNKIVIGDAGHIRA
jgi:hypothetical protein